MAKNKMKTKAEGYIHRHRQRVENISETNCPPARGAVFDFGAEAWLS
jgi:hypothetical protein